jgi:hypothetical protein
MQKRNWNRLLASTAALVFFATGCGGGGGSPPPPDGTGVIVTPAPTPPPTAAPTPPPAIFGALGQTTSQQFATLGFSYRGRDSGFGLEPDPTSLDTSRTIGLRLAAPSQLLLSIGGFGEGVMMPNGSGGTDQKGRIILLGYSALGGTASLQLEPRLDGNYLSSTGRGSWESPPTLGGAFPFAAAEFVYGVPTAPGSLPATGLGTFDFILSAPQSLTVDYGARTVSGTVTINPGGGTSRVYALRDVIFTGDGTQFRGRLATTDPALDGTIDGQFTGPGGAEMMGRLLFPVEQRSAGLVFVGARR